MKVSLKWLSEYVEVPSDIKAYCDRLDLTGTGVEGVETLGASFDNIVTAQVVSKEQHPDSDHMWVTKVDVGSNNVDDQGNPEPLQIVCGAQNFNEGDHIVTAMIGAVLPGDFKIKKSKLRGVASCGMNCSKRELGLGSDHDGIWILPPDAPIGVPLSDYLNQTDTVLDLEITPNRPDCLSIVGLARETGAMYQKDYTSPLAELASQLKPSQDGASIESLVKIDIEDPKRCPRYTARVIRGCKIGPSPDWMVERLAAIGQRSINNVVDVTNYILFLFGQPLHAFDYNSLLNDEGVAHIVVRGAHDGEVLETLDGEKRELTPDMTVISTPEHGAVALAGVMGGMDTEITEESTDILLEAATFEAGRTSRTSRNLGLISESSMRYERGVDDHDIDLRAAAAAALIVEVAGGEVVGGANDGLVDVWPLVTETVSLQFRVDRFNAMMGSDIPADFVIDILQRLGCTVDSTADPHTLAVVAPTYRPDLIREIDLYEEVLRLWGMDRIEATLPGGRGRFGERTHEQKVMSLINDTLRASGLNETMTYSFAEPRDIERLGFKEDAYGRAVELLNPLNTDQSIMRQSIIPGLLRTVAYNQSHGVKNIQLYEIGTVFSTADGRKKPKERQKIAGVLAGSMCADAWNHKAAGFDFFDGKGVLENIARELALPKVRFKALSPQDAPQLQPGRAAEMFSGGSVIGWIGEIHPLVAREFEVTPPVVAFELDGAALVKATRPARDYREIPTFPAVELDQAFVVNEDVTHEKMCQVMMSAGGKLLEDVTLFDVYRNDEHVGVGKKSMAYSLVYRASDRTLTAAEVDKAHDRLVKKVCAATGAEVRG